ncbi:MAG: hypothetical protein ACK5UI_00350 [Bacteroidota bacterium]|jgi:hypothetical protein
MKSGKGLIIGIVIGWIAIMVLVGYKMMSDQQQANSSTQTNSTSQQP